MKQLVFEFLRSQSRELPVPLDAKTQEELVRLMAIAIAAIHTQGVEGSDDTEARPDQGHGKAPRA